MGLKINFYIHKFVLFKIIITILQSFVENFTWDSKKLCNIQDFTISVFLQNQFYCNHNYECSLKELYKDGKELRNNWLCQK